MAQRLLIVEDEETLRDSLQRVFIHEGYEVDVVNNTEAALEIVCEEDYDLILTDIILPGLSGIELLKKCRKNNPDIIVIIITAFASIETAVEAMRLGAYEYQVKPIMHEEIKAIVRRALDERSTGRT